MLNKKVIILVMCSSNSLYKELEESIKETWFNSRGSDIEIIFYSDNDNEINKLDYPLLRGNNLILPCDDGYFNLGKKTIMAFDWVSKNYTYDYIYRSNLGAFINIKNLLTFLKNKPKDKFYCGIIGKLFLNKEIKFASGSGYILSNDVVNIILDNKDKWNHSIIDDVALGELLSNLKIELDETARRLSYCDDDVYYQIGESDVDEIVDDEIYHIRLRSNNRTKDINNMHYLWEKLKMKNEKNRN